jgi:hypothetical protein
MTFPCGRCRTASPLSWSFRVLSWTAPIALACTTWSSAAGATTGDLGSAFGWTSPTIKPFTASAAGGIAVEPDIELGYGLGTYDHIVSYGNLQVQPWSDSANEIQISSSWVEATTRTGAPSPTTGGFPERLYDFRVGGMYRHVTADKEVYGGNVSIGSGDPTPFSSAQATTISASLFWRVPRDDGDAWLWTLSYSNDRAILNNIPLPGVAYEWKPDPTCTVLIGLPFAFATWNPSPHVHLDIAGTILGFAHAGGWWKPFDGCQWLRLQAAYDWGNEVYKWPGHIADDQFVFFRSMKVTAGLGAELNPMISGSLYAGYAFDRNVIMGTSILQYADILDIPAGFIFGAMIRAGF